MAARVAALAWCVAAAAATPLDDYVSKPEPVFGWVDTGLRVTGMLSGGTAHILNVTSLQWMDETRAVGPQGAVWSHMVAMIVPDDLRIRNVSMAVLTGGCNEKPNDPPKHDEEYLEVGATLALRSGAIVAVVYQLPNCMIRYPSDPLQKPRQEDAMIAWAWHQYLAPGPHQYDPEWLPRLPMTKASDAPIEQRPRRLGSGRPSAAAARRMAPGAAR